LDASGSDEEMSLEDRDIIDYNELLGPLSPDKVNELKRNLNDENMNRYHLILAKKREMSVKSNI
jgi:hypothetical protein